MVQLIDKLKILFLQEWRDFDVKTIYRKLTINKKSQKESDMSKAGPE